MMSADAPAARLASCRRAVCTVALDTLYDAVDTTFAQPHAAYTH